VKGTYESLLAARLAH